MGSRVLQRRWLVLLVLLGACGGVYVDGNLPYSIPAITAFTATPDMLDAGGGESLLAWTVLYADKLFLAPDAGNVTGLTGGPVVLSSSTTFTLSAYNSLGVVSANVTITVAP